MVRAHPDHLKALIFNPMKSTSRILLFALALTGWAVADLPKKAPISKYTRLWTESPFTSKPPPPEAAGPEADPLEDYALLGVSPVTGGYRVTMMNKKDPAKRLIVESDRPTEGFKILTVTRKPGDPLGTVVRMSSGSVSGNVSFDPQLLTIAAPPAAAGPKPVQQPMLPGVAHGAGQGAGQGVTHGAAPVQPGQVPPRQPRPRVVPPAAPTQPALPAQLTQPARPGRPSSTNLRRDHRTPR